MRCGDCIGFYGVSLWVHSGFTWSAHEGLYVVDVRFGLSLEGVLDGGSCGVNPGRAWDLYERLAMVSMRYVECKGACVGFRTNLCKAHRGLTWV